MNPHHASLCVLLILASGLPATAAIVIPADLNPGDTYRIVFTTSGTRNGTSASIQDYDDFVRDTAEDAGLGRNWLAIASTSGISAIAHIGFIDDPIYNTFGQRVANNSTALWNTDVTGLQSNINFDENGNLYTSGVGAWTGTIADGSAHPTAYLGSAISGGISAVGSSSSTDNRWIHANSPFQTQTRHLFGISGIQTIAGATTGNGGSSSVPEPSSFFLAILGLLWVQGKRLNVIETRFFS